MNSAVLFNLSAIAALVPATLAAFRHDARRDRLFWLVTAVAIAGPLVWTFVQHADVWRTGLSETLWLTVASGMVLYAALSAAVRDGWRLAPLLLPYLLAVAILAALAARVPGEALSLPALPLWVDLHIILAVLAYGLTTLAAIAAAAVVHQEHSLKARKQRTRLTGLLPSVAGGEALQVGLLVAAEVLLGLGILSGMATEYTTTGRLFAVDHKSVFAFGAFVVLGALLALHFGTGLRGRRAARLLLLGYLFLTLAYPGLKFVTGVILP